MTSAVSGFITAMENVTNESPRNLWRNISVPNGNVIIISFKEMVPYMINAVIYSFAKDGRKTRIWTRTTPESDFAYVYSNVSRLGVRVFRKHCMQTRCFQLFFTFVPERETPLRLSDGPWNCSGGYYPIFQHHLSCNLNAECEDQRDESEHCPFSSPECQGRVALCGHCYQFVETLVDFRSDKTDVNQRANEFCNSLGGTLGMPKCVYDWRGEVKKHTPVHKLRLAPLWLGLCTRDSALPDMYRYVLISEEDQTALHHSVRRNHFYNVEGKFCFLHMYAGIWGNDCRVKKSFLSHGAVCQFRTGDSNRSTVISLSSTRFVRHSGHESLMSCADGQLTHTFVQCGSHVYQVCEHDHSQSCTFSTSGSYTPGGSDPSNLHTVSVPLFTCSDDTTLLSYTLICNFIGDCPDNGDELFCQHPPCVKTFACANTQCVSYDKLCDFVTHCIDRSDEAKCNVFKYQSLPTPYFPSPALIAFDGLRFFTAVPMNASEACPGSHYRCPGELNDCLPVYTRCNGINDCVGSEDEHGCEDVACPGFFRCRASRTCLHSGHLCDGWPHCPMKDDELACDVVCPSGCLCQGQSLLCSRSVAIAASSQVRSLDATGSNMTLDDVRKHTYLIRLVLAKCTLTGLIDLNLPNLRSLDLSHNRLREINMSSFLVLENLQQLSVSKNPIDKLYGSSSSTDLQSALAVIDLSFTTLTAFDGKVFSQYPQVQQLNLTFTSIQTISSGGFQSMSQLTELYMDGTPINTFPADIFHDLWNLRVITTDNYKLCCSHIIPDNFDEEYCHAPKDEISSCKDLLQSELYRGFLWIISWLSVTGNMFCFLVRLCAHRMTSAKSGYSVFVTNLSVADFLMGVYIAIIGAADQKFRGRYLHYDDTWKRSVICKMAGFLSLLSSEVSALTIWLITVDRFVVLRFPFSTLRFQKTSAIVACLVTWVIGCSLALLPLLPATSHWEFYSQSGICIPLPVTRREFKGRVYSISVLIILNFILFLIISAGQAFVYCSIQQNALKTSSTKVTRDNTIARRLITVAVTDFMCWFPISLCGILAVLGIPIPGEVNVALAIFVLPLNSAINPFMYTFNVVVEKRRKSRETKLLEYMEGHPELFGN